MTYIYDVYPHKQGPLPLVAHGNRVVYIGAFGEDLADVRTVLDRAGTARWQAGDLQDLKAALDRYFAGAGPLSVPYELLGGTAFQRTVWEALASIPYGQTCSYKELAARVGRPTAVRAVANAVGRNPLSILLPCHRILAHDGSLGGYRGGLAMKRILLAVEGLHFLE